MKIDINEVMNDIDRLTRESYKTGSYTMYKYNTVCLGLLQNLTNNLGVDVMFESFYNPYYEEMWNSKEKPIDVEHFYRFYDKRSFNKILTRNILRTFDNTNYYSIDRLAQQKVLKGKEFIDITESFLNDYDDRLLRYFKDEKDNNKIHISHNLDYCSGETDHIFMLGKQYILVNESTSIEGMCALVHELAHAYTFKVLDSRSKSQTYNADKSYIEFYSLYLERMLVEYLIKNHIYTKDTIISENNYLAVFKSFISKLNDYANLDENDTIEDYEVEDLYSCSLYGNGYQLAIIKAEDAKDNPKEVKKEIDDFICYQGLSTKEKELHILNVTKNRLIRCKELRETLERHNNRVKTI